jgi:hypothetical protein
VTARTHLVHVRRAGRRASPNGPQTVAIALALLAGLDTIHADLRWTIAFMLLGALLVSFDDDRRRLGGGISCYLGNSLELLSTAGTAGRHARVPATWRLEAPARWGRPLGHGAESRSRPLIQFIHPDEPRRISAGVLRGGAGLAQPALLAQVEGTAGRLVGAEHLEDLEAQMDMLRVAIELESHSDFGDLQDGDRRNRTSFLAHFPELGTALDEWDTIVERAQGAPGSVWGWFAQATSERGFTEPPFALGPLIDRLATLTVERARHGRLDTPHRLYLQRFDNGSTGGAHVSLYVEGQNVARLIAEPSTTPERQIEAAGQRVQALFDDAQSCEQAEEIASARDALLAAKQPLLARLALHASVDAIEFATSCPFCESGARPALSASRRSWPAASPGTRRRPPARHD